MSSESNMRPVPFANDVGDGAWVHTKSFGEDGLRLFGRPYFKHVFFGKLVRSMFLAAVKGNSALSAAIDHILRTTPKKQMVQVYARRIITFVAHFHLGRYLASEKRPHKAMHQPVLSMMTTLGIPTLATSSAPLVTRSYTVSLHYINILKKMVSDFRIRRRSSGYYFPIPVLPYLVEFIHNDNYSRCAHMFKS